MKTKVFSIILIAIVIASCVSKDKNAQLKKLLQQRDQISDQIKTLQDEIAKGDTLSVVKGNRVAVTELKLTPFNHFIEVQGKVDGDENVSVSCQSGGTIDQIFVKEGDHVSKGQVLAKLDDKVMQQSLKELQTSFDFVNSMYEKQKALWDQKIGSEVQFLSAKNNKESMEKRIATLKDQIALATMTSPINGTIEDMPIKIGQMMMPGLIAFRVVNFEKIKVVADLAEAYTSRVNDGDLVNVYFPDLNKEVVGKVNFSSKFINPTNRTFSVNVRLTGVDPKMKANMICVLKINDYKAEKATVIPINLVQTDQSGNYVVLAEKKATGAAAKRVRVDIGETYKGLIEITSGLKENDLVITSGYLDLENGQAINY
jgi:membrane fusion protein, multidrug efflux system